MEFNLFSCIVRGPDKNLYLYCKGADTIVFERLNASSQHLKDITTEHLDVSNDTDILLNV